jgi:hypothetical protein
VIDPAPADVVDVVAPLGETPPLGAVVVVVVVVLVAAAVEVVTGGAVEVVLWLVDVVLAGTVAADGALEVVDVWAWLLPPHPARVAARTAVTAPMRSLLTLCGLLLGSYGRALTIGATRGTPRPRR